MNFRTAFLTLALALPALAGAQSRFTEGQQYSRIDPPQPTHVAEGKIEVVEIFSYACVHCATFEPHIAAWKKQMPENAQFRGLPAVFSPAWEPYARAYFAAESLKVLDKVHEPLFKALHEERRPLRTVEEIADFAAEKGVDRAQFLEVANASSTTLKLNRAREQAMRYGIQGTPSMVVNGKYLVEAGKSGGFQGMIEVVNFLVAQEAEAAK